MNFSLTDEQQAIQSATETWARQELEPGAARRDSQGEFCQDVFLQCARELGLTRLPFPVEMGGLGLGMTETALAIEQISRYDQSLAVTLMVSMATGLLIAEHGTPEQQAAYLPGLIQGHAIGAVAGTEPQAGSWTAGYQTRATERGGEWVIRGEKAFITNAGTSISSVLLVCALSDEQGHMSLFAIPANDPGLRYGVPYDKLGWRSSATRPIYIDDVTVPASALLGERGSGRHLVHSAFKIGRILISAMGVGMAQGCLDHALKYAKERMAFGGPIGNLQLVQKAIADISVKVETARLLLRKAAWARDNGILDEALLSQTKYYCTEIASECADLAIQIHGGYGFMNECAPSRFWRDGRVLRIGDGTTEVQVGLIAKSLGL